MAGLSPSPVPVEPVSSEGPDEQAPEDTEAASLSSAANGQATASDGVDIDLTQLSSTMVYSEVYAMMYEPEQYVGKTIKMSGLLTSYQASNRLTYHACIVQDATACCAQGLEFELGEGCEYPEVGTEITLVGTFDLYQEEYNGNYYRYIILRNARLT